MLPPSANSGPLSDTFRAKVTSLIQEQLKPIVTELAAQQQTLLNHLALLKHNHNVNDYQMTRLEGIRDLEQSVNFKVSGVLGFDPWQHPTMGTNLREPVPADPQLIPKFIPVGQATPAERAAQSTALIKEAGVSARQIGVPLTFQDFPDHPSMNKGRKKEDPMHGSVPLFGLRAPRWRAKQGLDDHPIPGTAAYDGVVAPPVGRTGLQLYNSRARELKIPMWKLIEEGAGPLGIGAVSSSSSPGAGSSRSLGVQGMRTGATPSNTRTPVARHPTVFRSSSSSTPSARPRPGLYRTYAIANMEDSSILTSTPTSNKVHRPSALTRTSTMATIGSTTSETSSYSSLSRASTMATIGSEPSSSRTAKVTTAKTKTKTKNKESVNKPRSTRAKMKTVTPAPANSTSTSSTAPQAEQSKPATTLKRGRRTAELEDTTDDDIASGSATEEAEPTRKRRKPSAASNTSSEFTATTTLSGNGDALESGQGQGQRRRSTRVTRSSTAANAAAVPQPQPAPRGRATKGKKGNKRS